MCFGALHQDVMKSTQMPWGVQPVALSLFKLHFGVSDRCSYMEFKPVLNQISFVRIHVGHWP